ncbi:hypothetical protein BD309DRAFT_960820 [Dichomitus squalens]|uniref:EthD domain-containing protein n=2 Tax=Dichomitus squalens TaxID=114155 RepID=A0A4Q9PUN0_9APHY|nr:uncharacterized protein DICSQDRAFT_163694 [Dichomitus squalens LYAD-421 SS1]EJF56840.1 hypothetical protein DICSQDRAFT_163694 [Dichomitus squalens LYAD-421 SS1]TBU31077.1 hypothetical protein BD311DRAFT_753176 [Dichomitus squalens]TBU43369.1 hypothetical protein BD309DRAFT_960820 [Dichomitus squalens]TBU58223.1 hypothetical protein BD310DRAFT_927600 [Dichomitus squalens]
MSPPGLLFVFSEPGPNLTDDEFNDWYDNEHVPLRMAIPTFRRTTRWIAVDGEQPRYLATYDLDSCQVLDTPPYNTLVTTRSEREKDVISRTQLLDRRTYDLFEPDIVPAVAGYEEQKPGPYFITLQASVKPELEDDLNRWYREEHIPLLAKVPGWRRSRRYVLRDVGPASGTGAEVLKKGRPPKYLAVHEWESPESYETPEFKHATSTPWRMRLFEGADVWDRRLFKEMRTWLQEDK